ncbi:MAG: Fpg/Nei family DNA glycosylase [bacterium]
MPELPDLVYIHKKLHAFLPGKNIVEVKIHEPVVFRILAPASVEHLLKNARFQNVYRHGPFLGFELDNGFELVIHPMLAGRLKISDETKHPGRGLCLNLTFADGYHLFYLDDKKMGKVYLIQRRDYQAIPRYLSQGVNIQSGRFTFECFQALISSSRKQVRVFLMDQTALSAIGNAYADEILFDAGLHPKTFCYKLTEIEIKRLFESIKKVMTWGIAEVEKAGQPIEVKVREHLKVRNRKDQPCPRCGATIRRAGVLGFDAFFCPQCQPATRKQFIDWS